MRSILILFISLVAVSAFAQMLPACVSQDVSEFKDIANEYATLLCSADRRRAVECVTLAKQVIGHELTCLKPGLSLNQVRLLVTAFLRDEKIASIIIPAVLGLPNNSEESNIKYRLWRDFKVLIADQIQTPNGKAIGFKLDELRQLEGGYRLLRQALSSRVSTNRVTDFSHVWGAYGLVARVPPEQKLLKGQFGEVSPDFIFQINIVTSPLNFLPELVAQRIAHENGHTNDQLVGIYLDGNGGDWTSSPRRSISKACGLVKPYKGISLMSCFNSHPTWFNFHPTSYAATNPAEFQTKMIDEWVRENLGLVTMGRYRCQSRDTLTFWNEMENALIGEQVSPPCPTPSR